MTYSRVDSNQKYIVDGLRKFGATVLHTHTLKNAFDVLVGYGGKDFIIEIKDGKKPPSQRKLTPGELKFKNEWKGSEYYIVMSLEEAIRIIVNK
ncbi:MAG: hypothetical protein ACJA2M_000290 [Polaribacter sp.]|jgi:hypothetical protein